MKKIIITIFCMAIVGITYAQLNSSNDNSEYGIALKIDTKAKQLNLGVVHSESAKMRPTAGRGGWFLRYEKGWVYYNPNTGNALALWGDIMTKWGSQGYENGWLGFPVSDHKNTPNRTGAYVHFDKGSIYWSPATGSHCVGGAFRDYWQSKGWENSNELGFPKTDEIEIFINGYTRYQQFEKGTLFWGNGKNILYSNNPNATSPPNDSNFELSFMPRWLGFYESAFIPLQVNLYGWMDIRVYRGNGQEIGDAFGRSFSLFNIDKNRPVDVPFTSSWDEFLKSNMERKYVLSQSDIDANAYIRIFYWFNDKDDTDSDDYLKLEAYNGRANYNGGDHPYREIKIKTLQNAPLERKDRLFEGKEEVNVYYRWSLTAK
jgi:LGFP repeat